MRVHVRMHIYILAGESLMRQSSEARALVSYRSSSDELPAVCEEQREENRKPGEFTDPNAYSPLPKTVVPVSSLVLGAGPRLSGEDPKHTRLLAETETQLPPILIHRETMQVIDGAHRVRAALMRGDKTITAELFDGSEDAAFVLALERNRAHGLPLSRADRQAAAKRLVISRPNWSDRSIARSAGLSARTVRSLRSVCSTAEIPQSNTRIGQDGRTRPVDNTERRNLAAAMIANEPSASLRKVADATGISVSTAHGIRQRIHNGTTSPLEQHERGNDERLTRHHTSMPVRPRAEHKKHEIRSKLERLINDPSVKLNKKGRLLLKWLISHAVHPEEWKPLLETIPAHHSGTVAELARSFAKTWQEFAKELDGREVRVIQDPVI